MNLYEWDTKAKHLLDDVRDSEKRDIEYELSGAASFDADYDHNKAVRNQRVSIGPLQIREDVVLLNSKLSSLNEQIFYLSEKKSVFGWVQTLIGLSILLVLCDIQYSIFG